MGWPTNPFPAEQISTLRNSQEEPTTFSVVADSTPHTKGAYTELIASTSGVGTMLWLMYTETKASGVDTSTLLDLAIGGVGSEKVILPDIAVGFMDDSRGGNALPLFFIPFYIPSGSRVSARCQGAVISQTVEVSIDILGGGVAPPYFSACDVYGANGATSKGVNITAGTGGAKGAWSEIVASTGQVVDALIINFAGDDAMVNAARCILDIAVGAGSSEKIIVADYFVITSSGEEFFTNLPLLIPMAHRIPVGTRLAVRYASSNNNNADLYVHLHGLRL